MNSMIEKIARKCEARNLRYEIQTLNGNEYLKFGNYSQKHGMQLWYLIYIDKDVEDSKKQYIHILTSPLCHVDSPRLSIYKCLNDLNEYHYFTFHINDENNITASADNIVPYDSSVDSVWELLVCMMVMIEDIAYPALMKVIWE